MVPPASSASTGSVRRIDLGTAVADEPIAVGRGPAGVTVGGGEDDPGSQYVTVSTAGSVRAAGQRVAFLGGEDDDIGAGGRHIHF